MGGPQPPTPGAHDGSTSSQRTRQAHKTQHKHAPTPTRRTPRRRRASKTASEPQPKTAARAALHPAPIIAHEPCSHSQLCLNYFSCLSAGFSPPPGSAVSAQFPAKCLSFRQLYAFSQFSQPLAAFNFKSFCNSFWKSRTEPAFTACCGRVLYVRVNPKAPLLSSSLCVPFR